LSEDRVPEPPSSGWARFPPEGGAPYTRPPQAESQVVFLNFGPEIFPLTVELEERRPDCSSTTRPRARSNLNYVQLRIPFNIERQHLAIGRRRWCAFCINAESILL